MNEIAATLKQLGTEVRTALATVRRNFAEGLEAARIVGALLAEVKEQAGHGQWEQWLERETDLSARTAQRYMKFYQLALDTPRADLKRLQPIWDGVQGHDSRSKSDARVVFDGGDSKDPEPPGEDRAPDHDATRLGPFNETDAEFVEQSSETAPMGKVRQITDGDGREIPEHLTHTFDVAEDIKHIAREVTKLRTAIEQAAEAEPAAWSQVGVQGVTARLKLVSEALRLGCPYVVCSYCGGADSENCHGCEGAGFLGRLKARCAPEEMRP